VVNLRVSVVPGVALVCGILFSAWSASAQSGSLNLGREPAIRQTNAAVLGSAVDIGDTSDNVTIFAPVRLGPDSSVKLLSSSPLSSYGRSLLNKLRTIHQEYESMFRGLSGVHNTLRVIEAKEFYETTKLPSWTNAMYFRKQIVIPIDQSKEVDLIDLERSLRHEYFHAVTNALSMGRCPGWLDEGLAQMVEGGEHTALHAPLKSWIKRHGVVPLAKLKGGFTKLPTEMVAAAYGQSIVAARYLFENHGLGAIKEYLLRLRNHESDESAFRAVFHLSIEAFEGRILEALQNSGNSF
jgi:hypothetical protein